MKVYKIRNTEAFFETLSECKGEVKVIGKDGIGVTISPGSEEIKVLKNTYLGAMIDDVELKMNNSSDDDGPCCLRSRAIRFRDKDTDSSIRIIDKAFFGSV